MLVFFFFLLSFTYSSLTWVNQDLQATRGSLKLVLKLQKGNRSKRVFYGLKTIPSLLLPSERLYWDASLQMPTADFPQVLRDDGAALAWLEALRRVGVVYLRGAPAEQGQVARLVERIGYLRMTFYG